MTRVFMQLRLTSVMCDGLREAIRPFMEASYLPRAVADFCIRLYLAYYLLEADPDLEAVDFPIDQDEVLIINNFVSAEDGAWAKDVLHQTRQVLYELTTKHEAVRLASAEEWHRLFDGVRLEPNLSDKPEEEKAVEA